MKLKFHNNSICEERMSDTAKKSSAVRDFWFTDIFVIIFFIITAVTGLFLFRRDLMKTIENRDAEPVGTIVIRNNVVQRRHEDRMVWDRLYADSFVYSGDLIRAAEISSASINIEENKISLNENTLIRVQHSADRIDQFEVELKEGNLSLTSEKGSSAIMLNLMGNQVYTAPGTVLNAEASEEGIAVQVTEGSAEIVSGGQTKEISEGNMIAKDTRGVERIIPAAVVRRPAPNASYLKSNDELLLVNFVWNRINLAADDKLRLEISGDRSFSQGVHKVEGLGSEAQAAFDIGLWHWRLYIGETVLSTGQLTVADGSGPELLSPVANSVFRYKGSLPQLRFQWAERKGASNYIIEVSDTPEFESINVSRQSAASSFIYSGLGAGTWYWRVKPVFSSVYEGGTAYSDSSLFKIEEVQIQQGTAASASAVAVLEIEIPEPAPVSRIPVPIPPAPVTRAPEPQPAQGSSPPAVAMTRNRPPSRRLYNVRPGDTLVRIATQVYGDYFQWRKIFEANDIENPDLIYVDQVLFIP
ncbi:MAG: LysM peptidoglycan-binding domain-containing protein [Treponema sp.]|nr:LysM peptidoglycan-binding domain-containing protein [Treponema sp.]